MQLVFFTGASGHMGPRDIPQRGVHLATMLRRPSLPQISKIDMTPMAGVLICLLILFFAITPIYGCGPWAEVPQVSQAWPKVSDEAENISVGISQGGGVYFRGRRVGNGMAELGDLIAQYMDEHPNLERIVHVKADVNTRYAAITELVRVCRNAGATDVRLIAEARSEPWSW